MMVRFDSQRRISFLETHQESGADYTFENKKEDITTKYSIQRALSSTPCKDPLGTSTPRTRDRLRRFGFATTHEFSL